MRTAALLLAAAAFTSSAAAATAEGDARVFGAGGVACSQITADIAANPDAGPQIASWIMGYATASNRNLDDTWDLVGAGGFDAFYASVQAACVAAPEKTLEAVTFELLKGAFATRATAPQ